MRTAGEAVQRTDGKRGMSMRVRNGFTGLVRRLGIVNVEVGVTPVAVLMRMRMHTVSKGFAHAPDSDHDQNDSHQPLGNGRKRIQWQRLPKDPREQPDGEHSAGMT